MTVVDSKEILEYAIDIGLIGIAATLLESNIGVNMQTSLKLLRNIISVGLGEEPGLQLSVAADLNMTNAQRVLNKLSSDDRSDIQNRSVSVLSKLLQLRRGIGWQ